MPEILEYSFMQRAFLAALLFGPIAPVVGIFLVQRRLALLGDGVGHIATTGIGLALLLGTTPIPTAMVVAAFGALLVEVIRERSRTAGDTALALIFYGGIAGGVLLVSLASNQASSVLNSYLFADIAAVQGIPVRWMSRLLAVMAAVTVVVGMQIVGLLMVSAIMIVPIAAAQQVTRSFRATLGVGMVIGMLACVLGLTTSYFVDVPPGPTIVLLALASFALLAVVAAPLRTLTRR